jgi:uncharacterized protein RhaS with RHS repeats
LNYFRDYDPQTGRYIESVPIGLGGGSYSTYAYVGGNPLSRIDPFGLASCGIDLQQLIQNAIAGTINPNTKMQRHTGRGQCARTVRADIFNAGGPNLPPLGNDSTGMQSGVE